MSGKITGKNLHYDQTLPPFLARLHGQHVADADSPDPILAARRRAAKPRSASEEAEDAPVVVDDDGNVVKGLELGKDGTVRESDASKKEDEDNGRNGDSKDTVREPEAEKIAAIGASKKRKIGKVIGNEDGEDEDTTVKNKRGAATKTDSTASKKDTGGMGPAKGKKKAKKIKLSFGDDDGV